MKVRFCPRCEPPFPPPFKDSPGPRLPLLGCWCTKPGPLSIGTIVVVCPPSQGQWSMMLLEELEWFICQIEPKSGNQAGPPPDSELSTSFSSQEVGEARSLFRNLKVHITCIDILNLCTTLDHETQFLVCSRVYHFLKAFCVNNPKNQAAFHTHAMLWLFVRHLPLGMGSEALLLAMFDSNYDLCTRNNTTVIQELVLMLSENQVPCTDGTLHMLCIRGEFQSDVRWGGGGGGGGVGMH